MTVLVGFIAIGLMFGSGITGAAVYDISKPDGMYEFLRQGAADANSFNYQIPGFFKTLFGNERIIATITLSSGQVLTVSAVTKDAKVSQFQRGEIDNSTLRVKTDEATIRWIQASPDAAAAGRAAIDDKRIDYEAVTVTNKVVYGSTTLVSRVLSWFGW